MEVDELERWFLHDLERRWTIMMSLVSWFVVRMAMIVLQEGSEPLSSLMFTLLSMIWIYHLMFLIAKLHRIKDGTWAEARIHGFFSRGREASPKPLVVSRAA